MLKIYQVNSMNYGFLILKITGLFFCLVFVLRILGKREVGELSIFDLVVLLIIADVGALGIDNDEFLLPSYVCVFFIVILQKILSILLLKKSIFRNIIDGSPITIVLNGKLLIKNMQKEHYSVDDLISQMRLEHIMDINEIKLAILETNGTLSIFRTSKFNDVKLPVIVSGYIIKESLELLGYQEADFKLKLKDKNLNFKKIIYASLCHDSLYFFYRKNNKEEELEGHQLLLK